VEDLLVSCTGSGVPSSDPGGPEEGVGADSNFIPESQKRVRLPVKLSRQLSSNKEAEEGLIWT